VLRRCRHHRGCLSRFTALQSVVCDRLVGSYWFPTPAVPRRFRRCWRFVPVAVPRSLAQTGSSSRELPRLFRVLPFSSPPCASRRGAPSLGLRSLFATSAPGVVTTGFNARRLSVLGVSHALDGLRRQWPGGFVSPHSHVQGSPFRGLFLSHSRLTSSMTRALSSLATVRCRRLPAGSTHCRPALRALFRARIRARLHGV